MENTNEFSFQRICDKHAAEMEKIRNPNSSSLKNLIVTHPSNCVLPSTFEKHFKKIKDFKVYPDDTWLLGYPKCGTTWSQEMIWLLVNNVDFETAKSIIVGKRFPWLESELFRKDMENSINLTASKPRPRCIKSHLPVQLLPNELWTVKPKIVHVARDPKDVAISFYYHYRFEYGYTGTFEEYAEMFLADRVIFSPFWNNVLDLYQLKNEPNILFNTYEEMKKDLSGVIKKTATFLNKSISDHDLERLKEHLSFKSMKENPSCNRKEFQFKNQDEPDACFIRKGESGGWEKIFTDDLKNKFDEWNGKYLKKAGFDRYPWN